MNESMYFLFEPWGIFDSTTFVFLGGFPFHFRRCLAALQGGGVPWSYPGRTPEKKGVTTNMAGEEKPQLLKQNDDFSNDFYLHSPQV